MTPLGPSARTTVQAVDALRVSTLRIISETAAAAGPSIKTSRKAARNAKGIKRAPEDGMGQWNTRATAQALRQSGAELQGIVPASTGPKPSPGAPETFESSVGALGGFARESPFPATRHPVNARYFSSTTSRSTLRNPRGSLLPRRPRSATYSSTSGPLSVL